MAFLQILVGIGRCLMQHVFGKTFFIGTFGIGIFVKTVKAGSCRKQHHHFRCLIDMYPARIGRYDTAFGYNFQTGTESHAGMPVLLINNRTPTIDYIIIGIDPYRSNTPHRQFIESRGFHLIMQRRRKSDIQRKGIFSRSSETHCQNIIRRRSKHLPFVGNTSHRKTSNGRCFREIQRPIIIGGSRTGHHI